MGIETADLCDMYRGEVRVLPAGFISYGGIGECSGRVSTISKRGDVGAIKAVLEEDGSGKILVVDAQAESECAMFGEKMAQVAIANGWVGLIINGMLRDSRELKKLELAVWALGTRPCRSWDESAAKRDVSLTIGTIAIHPGDYVYCDEDGIIFSEKRLDQDVARQEANAEFSEPS